MTQWLHRLSDANLFDCEQYLKKVYKVQVATKVGCIYFWGLLYLFDIFKVKVKTNLPL